MKQFELRAGGFKSRRLARHEKHTGTLFGRVRLAVEGDDARFRRRDHVDEVIVAAGLHVELPAVLHRSLIHGQRLRTAQIFAAKDTLQSGCDRFGFRRVPINDRDVVNCWHAHSSNNPLLRRGR